MGARERNKGSVFEREIATVAREHGFTGAARGGHRQVQEADSEACDVVEIGPLWCECKRQERIELQKWMRQALHGASRAGGRRVPVVVSRQSRQPALGGPLGRWAAVPFDWLLDLVHQVGHPVHLGPVFDPPGTTPALRGRNAPDRPRIDGDCTCGHAFTPNELQPRNPACPVHGANRPRPTELGDLRRMRVAVAAEIQRVPMDADRDALFVALENIRTAVA